MERRAFLQLLLGTPSAIALIKATPVTVREVVVPVPTEVVFFSSHARMTIGLPALDRIITFAPMISEPRIGYYTTFNQDIIEALTRRACGGADCGCGEAHVMTAAQVKLEFPQIFGNLKG